MLQAFTIILLMVILSLGPLPANAQPQDEIYIIRHRFHTGLAMDRSLFDEKLLGPLLQQFSAYRYLEVGWGDREFYMASGDSIWLAIRAMLWPTDSVMHVSGFNKAPAERFPDSEMVAVPLETHQITALNRFVADHFKSFTPLGEGLYGPSYFYPAKGSFHLFRTCNVWTAESLAAAELDISSFLALSARSVLDQSAEIGRVVRSEAEAEALAH